MSETNNSNSKGWPELEPIESNQPSKENHKDQNEGDYEEALDTDDKYKDQSVQDKPQNNEDLPAQDNKDLDDKKTSSKGIDLDTPTPKNRLNSKPKGESVSGRFKLATLSGFALLVGFNAFTFYQASMYSNHNDATSESIDETRSQISDDIANVEEKLVDVINTRIAPMEAQGENDKQLLIALESQLAAIKSSVKANKILLTNLSEKESFNAQLVDVISTQNDKNKNDIASLESNLARIESSVLKQKSARNNIAKNSEPIVYALKSVGGFKFFNVELWGDEKIAVFTKGNKTVRVKTGETIEGYFVEKINLAKRETTLTKSKKYYLVTVR